MPVENWDEFIRQTDKRTAAVRKGVPETAKGFAQLAQSATAPGALDTKTKELLALAIGITGVGAGFALGAEKKHMVIILEREPMVQAMTSCIQLLTNTITGSPSTCFISIGLL